MGRLSARRGCKCSGCSPVRVEDLAAFELGHSRSVSLDRPGQGFGRFILLLDSVAEDVKSESLGGGLLFGRAVGEDTRKIGI